jgi:hypothetical protein
LSPKDGAKSAELPTESARCGKAGLAAGPDLEKSGEAPRPIPRADAAPIVATGRA